MGEVAECFCNIWRKQNFIFSVGHKCDDPTVPLSTLTMEEPALNRALFQLTRQQQEIHQSSTEARAIANFAAAGTPSKI
jgi:hypothetical protein